MKINTQSELIHPRCPSQDFGHATALQGCMNRKKEETCRISIEGRALAAFTAVLPSYTTLLRGASSPKSSPRKSTIYRPSRAYATTCQTDVDNVLRA